MSLPPHRPPFLFNKYCEATRSDAYEFCRPGAGSKHWCDPGFLERMDVTNPMKLSHFPRYKNFDGQVKNPPEAVMENDVVLSPRGERRWGATICNTHSPWRSSFPDRMPRLEGNDRDMTTGMKCYKTALESIPNGRENLSYRRLRYMKKTQCGKVFNNSQGNRMFANRWKEGADAITRTPAAGGRTVTGWAKPRRPSFWSESECSSRDGSKQHANRLAQVDMLMRTM